MSALNNLSNKRIYNESLIREYFDNPVCIDYINAALGDFKGMLVITVPADRVGNTIKIVAAPIDDTKDANASIYNYGKNLMEVNPGKYRFFNLTMPV